MAGPPKNCSYLAPKMPMSLDMGPEPKTSPRQTRTGVATADALTMARRRIGFSVDTAADALHIGIRELYHYESGFRTPSGELIAEMARLYGVEPERLGTREWVPRVPPRFDERASVLWLGWMPIEVKPGDNEHLIRSVAGALRTMRSLDGSDPIFIRASELPLLAGLLDLDDPRLVDHLANYLTLNDVESLALLNEMVMIEAVGSFH